MHYGQTRDDNGDELDFTEPFQQEIDEWKEELILAGMEIDRLTEENEELRLEIKVLKDKLKQKEVL